MTIHNITINSKNWHISISKNDKKTNGWAPKVNPEGSMGTVCGLRVPVCSLEKTSVDKGRQRNEQKETQTEKTIQNHSS